MDITRTCTACGWDWLSEGEYECPSCGFDNPQPAPLAPEQPSMVTICSWCDGAAERTAAAMAFGRIVSHTICDVCRPLWLAEGAVLMVSVNLYGDHDAHVKAKVLGGGAGGSPRFISFNVGALGVILPSAAKAREIASALNIAADELDAANTDGSVTVVSNVGEVAF